MSKNKSLMPLAAITTVLFLAVITRPSPDATSSDGVGALMLPDLKTNAEAIDGITIRQGGGSISLQRDGGQWYCASAAPSARASGAASRRIAASRVLSYRPLPLANSDGLTLPQTAATGSQSFW